MVVVRCNFWNISILDHCTCPMSHLRSFDRVSEAGFRGLYCRSFPCFPDLTRVTAIFHVLAKSHVSDIRYEIGRLRRLRSHVRSQIDINFSNLTIFHKSDAFAHFPQLKSDVSDIQFGIGHCPDAIHSRQTNRISPKPRLFRAWVSSGPIVRPLRRAVASSAAARPTLPAQCETVLGLPRTTSLHTAPHT